MKKYTTYGPVRGMGQIRTSREKAMADLADDHAGCATQGGYSDRDIYEIDADGYLIDENGEPVWPPHGKSCGAVRAIWRKP